MARSTSSPAEHRLRTWAITGLALVALLGLTAGVAASPLFGAKDLSTAGGDHLGSDEILGVAGVKEGTNLVYLSPSQIEARLEAHPWIEDASVTRELPGRLSITIEERVPAAFSTRGGTTVLIASDGTTLETGAGHVGDLPAIRGVRPGALGAAPAPMLGPAHVAAALEQRILDEHPTIDVGPDGQVDIELKNGLVVTYGDAVQVDEKALAIAGVLSWADEQHADIIAMDVRVPYSPTAKVEQHGQQVDSGIIPLSPPSCKDDSSAKQDKQSPSPSPVPASDHKKNDCARTNGAKDAGPADGAVTP